MANNTMREGILRECIEIVTTGTGQLAIEDSATGKTELVDYDIRPAFKALGRYKGKMVYWNLDNKGLLARLEPAKVNRQLHRQTRQLA